MAKAQGQGDKWPWPLGYGLILRVLGAEEGSGQRVACSDCTFEVRVAGCAEAGPDGAGVEARAALPGSPTAGCMSRNLCCPGVGPTASFRGPGGSQATHLPVPGDKTQCSSEIPQLRTCLSEQGEAVPGLAGHILLGAGVRYTPAETGTGNPTDRCFHQRRRL